MKIPFVNRAALRMDSYPLQPDEEAMIVVRCYRHVANSDVSGGLLPVNAGRGAELEVPLSWFLDQVSKQTTKKVKVAV
jgi:hypothetical protein